MSRFVGRLLNCSVFIVFLKSTERLALVGTALVLFLFPFHSNAQIDNNFFNGGGIRVGDSTTACAGNGGGIRFDADSSDGGGLQYCDGTSWLDILTGTITGDVSQGGNSFAAPMIIGTNDNNTLAFETNGSTRMTIDTSGNVGIGTDNPGYKLHVNGSVAGVGAYNALSDQRYKRNITSLESPLENLLQIEGFHYDWAHDEYPNLNFPQGKDMGVIAQDVQKVFPEAVSKSDDGVLSVAYSKLIAPIIESIRELYQKYQQHEEKLAEKDLEIAELKKKNQGLEKRLLKIEELLSTHE